MNECSHIEAIIKSLEENQGKAIDELIRIESKLHISDHDKELMQILSDQIRAIWEHLNKVQARLSEICPGFRAN